MKRLEKIEEGLTRLLSTTLERIQPRIDESQPLSSAFSNLRISVSARTVRALKKFRGDENVRFKSPEQTQALQLILDGKKDALAILSIGEEKSLLFFLSMMLDLRMTTVMIVRLIAAMNDLRRKTEIN